NQTENYFRWSGAICTLNGALAGGETDLVVDTLLTADVFESQTATNNSATTVDVSTATWASSQWVGMYIYFPSTGKVRKITANTGTQITFNTLGAGPGNIAFQIRNLIFPLTGSVIYNGTVMAYTAIDVYNKLPVSSAVAAPDGTGVAEIPTSYSAAPRGNRLCNYLGRVVVANVRSAITRDSGGALQGFSASGSVFVSKLNNPYDLSFAATRVAGEGDIFNKTYKTFEGIWNVGADALLEWNNDVYFSQSNGCNVSKMLTGHSDVVGTNRYPIISEYATHFMNLTGSKSNLQAMHSIFVEGYIKDGTTITFNLWKAFEETPFLTFNFSSSQSDYLDFVEGQFSNAFLGGVPLAINPLAASFSDITEDGRRHFSFRVYFPFTYSNYFSVGHSSEEKDDDYEITRYGLGIKEDVSVDSHRIKII
ncbi:hypothetical protein HY310_00530, partial [Candidatus Microgenomates bacterium]|nr:hypothetical protein [Candidatus Microgenomates bacterium]